MEEQSDTPRTDAAEQFVSYFGWQVHADFAQILERELAAATRERDEARALNAQWAEKAAAWFASPEAAQRLQGYRDLAQQVAAAQNERDEARAALLAIELAAASLADAQVIALEALAARADNEPNRLPSHRCSSLCSPDETFCAITKDGKCDAMDRSCDAAPSARADHEVTK